MSPSAGNQCEGWPEFSEVPKPGHRITFIELSGVERVAWKSVFTFLLNQDTTSPGVFTTCLFFPPALWSVSGAPFLLASC